MTAVDFHHPNETQFRRNFLIAGLGAGVLAGLILVSFPEIDLWFSASMRRICSASSHAGWCRDRYVLAVRSFFIFLFWLACLASMVALAIAAARKCAVLGACRLRWMIVMATLVIGPGVVANLVFKDNWGRARPRDVAEFGGERHFSPALAPVSECERNCSFISGEASSMYAVAFAGAMVWPQVRLMLLVGGIGAGLAAGLVRVSQGAHFLSDIVFAGVFMALSISLVHILLVGVWRHVDRKKLVAELRRRIVTPIAAELGLKRATPTSTHMPWNVPGLD